MRRLGPEAGFEPLDGMNPLELPPLFFLDDADFGPDSVTRRCGAKRRGLLRNAALAIGNRPHTRAIPALVPQGSMTPIHWCAGPARALGNYESSVAAEALHRRLACETDP